ncbi:TIP41-like protein [Gossypium australe]|uniref:TIP41-like protein n=1 Tax=Gossypium australe TaxID=47621 RepID=A0A5B6X398_9ROSI|nr:TIP41-like protein [Gossypium australe]
MGTKTPNFATLPEMIFGESCLVLFASGNDICFNALDAFSGWKHEGLPPVEVPSPAQWKFRRTQGKKFQRGAQASIGRIAHCGLMSLRSHEKNQFFSVIK